VPWYAQIATAISASAPATGGRERRVVAGLERRGARRGRGIVECYATVAPRFECAVAPFVVRAHASTRSAVDEIVKAVDSGLDISSRSILRGRAVRVAVYRLLFPRSIG